MELAQSQVAPLSYRQSERMQAPVADAADDPIQRACNSMHRRLITWGRLELRGGSGQRQEWDSDASREYFAFTPRDYDDAKDMSAKVRQLPKPQQWITLQEFYADDDLATTWELYSCYRREYVVLPGLVRAINARLRREVNARLAGWERYPEVRAADVDGIRWRAVRQLVNREAIAEAALSRPRGATYGQPS